MTERRSDPELAKALAAGDESALEELYDLYGQEAVALAYRLLGAIGRMAPRDIVRSLSRTSVAIAASPVKSTRPAAVTASSTRAGIGHAVWRSSSSKPGPRASSTWCSYCRWPWMYICRAYQSPCMGTHWGPMIGCSATGCSSVEGSSPASRVRKKPARKATITNSAVLITLKVLYRSGELAPPCAALNQTVVVEHPGG